MSKNKNKREEQCAAMQVLLDSCKQMRKKGISPESINDRLKPALIEYKRGRYDKAKDYAHAPIFTCIAI